MAARSRSFPTSPKAFGSVAPAWLEPRLGSSDLRILDVRPRVPPAGARGPDLRPAQAVELRGFAHLGAPAGWKASRDRYPAAPGPSAAYPQGHVSGAVAFDVRALLFDESGEVVSAPELAIAMSSAGVGDEHTIILVDEGQPSSALAAGWALLRYGPQDVHLLEGGFARWLGEGRPTSRAVVKPSAASFTARGPS